MNIGYLLINTVFSAVTALLIFIFLKFNFNYKCKTRRLLILLGVFGFVNGFISTLWTQYINVRELQLIKPIILFFICLQTIKFVLKINWSKAILSFFVVMAALGFGNYITPILFSIIFKLDVTTTTISNDIILYLKVNVSILIVCTLITISTYYFTKLRKINNLKPISVLFGIALFVMIININTHFVEHYNIKSFTFALILSFAFLIIAIIYINKYQRNEDHLEEKRQQEFYNESLCDTLQELRRYKHDHNNHLSVLNYMIMNKQYDETAQYISEIYDSTNSINTSVFNIKNVALFAIISAKMDKAKKAGIKFDLKTIGTVGCVPVIKVSELCEVVGIYTDNAIEAAQESNDKIVEMTILAYDNGNIDFKIVNSCDTIPKMNMLKIDGYSTKGSDRGHGLAIVEKILSKYKFVLNNMIFDENERMFIQDIKIKKA